MWSGKCKSWSLKSSPWSKKPPTKKVLGDLKKIQYVNKNVLFLILRFSWKVSIELKKSPCLKNEKSGSQKVCTDHKNTGLTFFHSTPLFRTKIKNLNLCHVLKTLSKPHLNHRYHGNSYSWSRSIDLESPNHLHPLLTTITKSTESHKRGCKCFNFQDFCLFGRISQTSISTKIPSQVNTWFSIFTPSKKLTPHSSHSNHAHL